MVPLDRALVNSYRLYIVAMPLTKAVWPQLCSQYSYFEWGSIKLMPQGSDWATRRTQRRTISSTVNTVKESVLGTVASWMKMYGSAQNFNFAPNFRQKHFPTG